MANSDWSTVIRPLLSVPVLQCTGQEIKHILQFLQHRSGDFDQASGGKFETFYSSYVGLSVNFLISNAHQVAANHNIEPAVQCLLKYLLNRCETSASPDPVLGVTEVTTLIHSLCTADATDTVSTPQLTQYAASLRGASLPPYITHVASDESSGGGDSDGSKASQAPVTFLNSLSTLAMEAEFTTDNEYKERSRRQHLSEVSCNVFTHVLNGQQVLLDYLSALPYLSRYSQGVQALINNGDMPKLSPSDCDTFSSAIPTLLTHMGAVSSVLSMPALYTRATQTSINKMNHLVLTCLYAGSYAILSSAVNPSTEFQSAAAAVASKAVDVLTVVGTGIRQSPRVSKHVHTNLHTTAGWLIFTTLDSLTQSSSGDLGGKQAPAETGTQETVSTNSWGLSAHRYAIEGLSCLIFIAKDSNPGHVSSKPQPTSSSARLQEAHKFSMSQFNMMEEYVYLELIKFVCSGSNLTLSTIIFSTIASLMVKYTYLVHCRQRKDQQLEAEDTQKVEGEAGGTTEEGNITMTTAANPGTPSTPVSGVLVSMLSSCNDDSSESFGDLFGEMFSEEAAGVDRLVDSASPPGGHRDDDAIVGVDDEVPDTWVEVATSYVTFLDKFVVSSPALKSYLYNELCHSRSQQALSMLAVVVKSTSHHNDDDKYEQFCVCVRKMCRHLIHTSILDRPAQENMLLMLHLFPDNLIGWPLYAHKNLLSLLMDVMMHWQSSEGWDKEQVVVVDMWRHFLDSILSECITADHNVSSSMEDVNVEHCQVLLALLYTLSDSSKQQVFVYLAKTLIAAVDIPRTQLVTMVPLPVTRLCLLLEYLLQHLSTAPPQLLEQIKNNVLGEQKQALSFFDEGDLESVFRKHWKSDPATSVHWLDPLTRDVLMKGDLEEELQLSDLYKHCMNAMLAGSSLDKVKKAESMNRLDSCAVHYHIKVVWRLLALLPPPPAFLLQMTDISTLGTQVAALQAVCISPRLRNPSYVEWYKSTLEGTLTEDEINGLIENVTLKTKSPLFEVEITLHILQAQMASLTFASHGEVIEPENLPGFHNIVILDAVLSQTLSLVDSHYQKLKDTSTEEGSAYEEAKQMELKRAADDLLPALLLMLGSFTEFVRSSLLYLASQEVKDKSAYAYLLPLTSSPDKSTFGVFTFQPTELSQVLSEWKTESFDQFPTFGSWTENCSEMFTNSVIQGHCSTLSSRTAHWSTLVSLRHLQMTLIKLTCDLCSWFPMMDTSTEVCRILVPLLFDGSVSATSVSHITDCFNQVIGQTKLKEEEYTHMMSVWNTAMLNLSTLSDSLSSKTCSQMVQIYSFFMQSCMEDKMVVTWLTNFYTTNADAADILLVTGLPGCADIMSINRILKIFTKLISLADSEGMNSYSTLLKSLNKLSTLGESKLCQWLLSIIMASPYESESGDIESEVERNAYLLHSLATYMVQDNGLVDKEVAKAILESLISVANQVLHQTLNAQGFQELMLIMSTLAKSGEVVGLFSAVISWVESCIPYLTTAESDGEGDSPSKYNMFVELANSLLSYITDVLAVVKGRGIEKRARKGHREAVTLGIENVSHGQNLDSQSLPEPINGSTSDLDNQLCTFTQTQRDFKQQHWYHCYTCGMTDGVGVCSVCVKVCHKDHDVSYAKHGSFFCDCGEKGDKFCSSLKKRSLNDNNSASTGSRQASSVAQKGAPAAGDAKLQNSRQSKIASALKEQRAGLAPLFTANRQAILAVIEKCQLVSVMNKLISALQPKYLDNYTKVMPQVAASKARSLLHELATKAKDTEISDKLMVGHMSASESTFDGVKASFSGDQGTTIKQLINSHVIRRHIMAKVTGGKEPMLAVANDKGKITILQIANLFKSYVGKPPKLPLTRCKSLAVPFSILSMAANPVDNHLIAVCGLKECHVLSISDSGTVAKSIILHPSLDTGNFIVKAEWIGGKGTELAVVTADFIKIYSLDTDVISPQYYYLLPTGKVRDVTFCHDRDSGHASTLLVMSSSGHVYTQVLDELSRAVHGPFYITSAMEINLPSSVKGGRPIQGGGASIYYSHSLRLLMLSFVQGQTFCCSLDPATLTVNDVTQIAFSKGKMNSAQPMVQWSESHGHPGLIFCITQSTNNPLALYITPQRITVQEVKCSMLMKNTSKNAKVLDYVAMRCHISPAEPQTYMMVICEDGSLKILKANDEEVGLWIHPTLNPRSPFASLSFNKPTRKKSSSKKGLMANNQMPVDFFESCAQTNDIEFGGNDMLEVYHKNLIKQRLASTNQYIACTKPDSFKIEVINTAPSHVIVGVRIQVGGHLITRLPSYIEMFGKKRNINTDRQRWVDFPFTREESILANNKFVITVGSSTHADHVTFIDSIRVYSKSKDAFAWSEEEASRMTSPSMQQQRAGSRAAAIADTQAHPRDDQADAEDMCESEEGSETSGAQATCPLDRLLADALTVLTLYFTNTPTSTLSQPKAADKETEAIEEAIRELVVVLPPPCVDKAVKSLLQALHSDKNAIIERMDSLVVDQIIDWMKLDIEELNPCTYQMILYSIQQLGSSRPETLRLLFRSFCTDEDRADTDMFLNALQLKFFQTYWKRAPYRTLTLAGFPGFQNVRATVCALVDVFFMYGLEKREALSDVVANCLALLFHHDPAVGFAAKQAMIKILKPRSRALRSDEGADDKPPTRKKVNVGAEAAAAPAVAAIPNAPQVLQAMHHVPMDIAAEILPPEALDLQEWLGDDHLPPTMDDLEFAIALSMQDHDDEEGDEEDIEDEEEDEDLELVEAADDGGDAEFEEPTAGGGVTAAEVDSDGGQMSTHSSMEAVQNVGLDSSRRAESFTALPPSGDVEDDSQQRKLLGALVMEEMMLQGVGTPSECSAGLMPIPYLQVMLMLLSDLESPADYAVIEKYLAELLEQNVNLKQDWSETTGPSRESEIELVVLRLFSVLMSRSHHSECPTGSKLNVCAASVLIKAQCVDHLLPLLKHLLQFWKTFNPDTSDSNSLLLSSRRVISKYDMSPFFLKQYVKEHPYDVFEVFPQLQTEMVLRLVNQLKKISDSSDQLDSIPFSEEWTSVLSEYMGVCEAAFIKRQVRKLLNNICGTKENYRRVRDTNTIGTRMALVKEAAIDCGLTETISSVGRSTAIPYTTLTAMVDNLRVIQDIASSRCINWQKYCVKNPGTIELVLLLCVQVSQGLAESLLSLLHSAVTLPTSSKSSGSSSALRSDDDVALHKQIVNEILTKVRKDLVCEFLRVYLLQSNQTPLREKMHAMVLSLHEQADDAGKITLLNLVWSLWPHLSMYGKKASMFVDILGYMIIKTDLEITRKTDFVKGVVDLLTRCNHQLQHHQNTNIYNMLQELVDLEGFYLEREPCMTCNDPEIPYSNLKLNNIKVDNKFTTSTQMIKLTSSHMISRIHLRISDIKKSKMVKSMTINYSNRTVQSAVELKNRVGIWQLAKRVNLASNQNEVKIDFTVPITASNLMIEYSEFYENNQAVQESLPCPRCSASVPANPGICVNCGENVFQCHKCRSINYDEKDPFLCNTCGFCKYAKFDMSLTARPCSAVDPIESEEDRTKALSSVNSMLEKADKTYSDMQNTRSTLERLIMQLSATRSDTPTTTSSSVSGHVNTFIQQVAAKYCDESKKHFEELSKSMQKVLMCRRELLEFDRKQNARAGGGVVDTPSSASVSSQSLAEQLRSEAEENERIAAKLRLSQQSSSSCYGCLTVTVYHCISLLRALSTQPFATDGHRLIKELVSANLNSGPMYLRHDAMQLLCVLTKNKPEANTLLYNMLYERICEAMQFCTSAASLAMNIRSELAVISLSVHSDSQLWEDRMRVVIKLYSQALLTSKSHVIEAVALSCLAIIKGQIIIDSKPLISKHKDKSLQEIAGVYISERRAALDVGQWLCAAQGHTYSDWRRSIKSSTSLSGEQGSTVRHYFNTWRQNARKQSINMADLDQHSWLSSVLFNPASQTCREMCAEIVSKMCEVPHRKLLLVSFLSKLLSKVPAAGTNASHFITLYKQLISEPEVKYYLIIKHNILILIAKIISTEIANLSSLEETTLGSDLSQGWGLQALVTIVKGFLEDERIRQKYKSKLVGTVLDGYLSLRKLVVQRTKMIESTQELLLGLLEQLTTGTEAETREFMSVCIETVAKYSPSDLRSPVFIFERLCSIIRPEENSSSDFLMILEKDPQQEDFLQGRMSGNPYLSKEPGLGPLMRDVKNKICTDCELVALLDDDSGMELLVNNKIISLDLPVADVYRKVWQPNRENDPMRIVYRMRGLLGDATEDMVDSLQSNNAEEEDAEKVYRMSAVMQQCGGLDAMLSRLDYVHNYHRGKQLVEVLLKLFGYCLKLSVNRRELIKPDNETMSVMLRALNRALRAEQQVGQTDRQAGSSASQAGQSNTEKVLQLMEIVLSEASHLPQAEYTEFTKRCGDSNQLLLLLERIDSPFVRSNPPVLEALMKLIPFLACGEDEKMSTLVEHFKPYLNLLQFDSQHTDNEVTYLECFCVITSGIKENANGCRLKQMIIDREILSDAIHYIAVRAPVVKTLLATDMDDWKEFVGRPVLPYVLRLLNGLCSGHPPSQEKVGEAMIPILHKLEHMSSHGQIGSLAENLMETLCQNEKVSEQIKQIRAQTRAEKKRLAMAVREKHLSSIGMKTNKKGQVVVTSSVMKEADSLKDETGIVCSICREGYHNQPNKVLAVYTFTKRVNVEEHENRARKLPGLFTVSHMNIVHIDCHTSAVRLANGRDEWESAALHNANTKCNGLLPLWGPQVTESNFAAALAKHNSYLRDSTDLRDDSYTLTVHDIKLLLLRFAHEQPFSADGGGGGRNSNMLLVPYELLLALYVIQTKRTAKVKEKNLQAFIGCPRAKWVESSFEVDGPAYWLIICLALWSRDVWNNQKLVILKRLFIMAQTRVACSASKSCLLDKTVLQYSVYKPVIVLFGLVDALYNTMFKSVPCDKDWVEGVMTYIRNNDIPLAESSEKIVSFYESELLPCESLAEAFDVLGLLGDVPDVDAWVRELMQSV